MAKNKRRKQRGRGEGSISQRPSGRWEAKITVGYDGNGRRIRRAVYGDTKEEVQDKLMELRGQAKAGTLVDPTTLTLAEYLTNWLANTVKPKTSPTTHARYESLVRLKISPHIGGLKVSTLVPMHVYHLMGELERAGESLWTRKLAGTLLHNALKQAVRLRLLSHNPAADVPRAKPAEKEMRIFTEPEVRTMIEAAKGRRYGALFVTAVGTGLRQGELLALQWTDIDFEKGTLSVRRTLAEIKGQFVLKEPKSKHSRRTITLPGFVLDALRQHRAKMLAEGNIAGPVFCSKGGTWLRKSNMIRQAWKPMLKKAGLPVIRFHDLRHTHASLLLAHGESIKEVSRRLGHGTIDITLRVYAHLLPDADATLSERMQKMFG
jgi:integrase